jgi:hypothetical protein
VLKRGIDGEDKKMKGKETRKVKRKHKEKSGT